MREMPQVSRSKHWLLRHLKIVIPGFLMKLVQG